MTEAEIALIVQEARYGTDCPVSGNFDAAVRDAVLAGYRAAMRDVATELRVGGMTKGAVVVEHWLAKFQARRPGAELNSTSGDPK